MVVCWLVVCWLVACWLKKKGALIDFFYTFVIVSLSYRILLYVKIYTTEKVPLSFEPSRFPLLALIGYFFFDIVFGALLAGLFSLFTLHFKNSKIKKIRTVFSIYGYAFVCIALILISTLIFAHLFTIFAMFRGLEFNDLLFFLKELPVKYVASFQGPVATALMGLIPVGIFFGLRSLSFVQFAKGVAITSIIVLAFITFLAQFFLKKGVIPKEYVLPPLAFTFQDGIKRALQKDEEVKSSKKQNESLSFIDKSFINPKADISKNLNQKVAFKKWNILYIVLESTGSPYVFDQSFGNDMPAPFMYSLTKKSLFFKKHYATSNTSPRALFALLSGLYPSPRVSIFAMRRDLVVPAYTAFLSKTYKKFLVTPSNTTWYFPRNFLRNNGFSEIYDINNMPLVNKRPHWTLGLHEGDVTNFLISKLKKTPDPFFALYITFAPHYPYFRYDKKIDLFKKATKKVDGWVRAHYNNLRLQDNQIKKLFSYLKKSNRLKNTILIIIGDHSEAFGQHPSNFTHATGSYEENYRVPALIYQPRIFKPQIINQTTIHVDILPTLLDGMGIRYNANLMQGESIFQRQFKRKFIFMYGNENVLTAIDSKSHKVQFGFKDEKCWVYNLKKDPFENKSLPCSGELLLKQRKVILKFRRYQPKILERYNNSILKGKSFYGQSHPNRLNNRLIR